jgi:hypothetical protein
MGKSEAKFNYLKLQRLGKSGAFNLGKFEVRSEILLTLPASNREIVA